MSHKQEHANIVLIRAGVGSRIFTEILSEWLQLRGVIVSPPAQFCGASRADGKRSGV
ncbi:MAG: hypothetical protein KME26_26190 [Oscillatoria princeps RMCB-10]|nr:hypothetical protein [Oscillatoria princeps RMCB-10]